MVAIRLHADLRAQPTCLEKLMILAHGNEQIVARPSLPKESDSRTTQGLYLQVSSIQTQHGDGKDDSGDHAILRDNIFCTGSCPKG